MAAMMLYDWPGNVRELENAIEYAFVLCPDKFVHLEYRPERLHPETPSDLLNTALSFREIERRAIEQALRRNNWRKMVTARELGIDKNTLRSKIGRYRIKEPQQRV